MSSFSPPGNVKAPSIATVLALGWMSMSPCLQHYSFGKVKDPKDDEYGGGGGGGVSLQTL